MEFKAFLNLIGKRKPLILLAIFAFFIIFIGSSLLSPLRYRATTRLLVVQTGNTGDAYSISRSNQFLSNVLAEVVYSNSFFEQVLASGYNIDKNIFSADPNENMKRWKKIASAQAISDTGTIVINTYHENPYQASQINQAIAFVLKTKHSLYHGLGDKVLVKVIDKTMVSNWPVKPNLILNGILAIVLGFISGLGLIYLYPEKDFKFKEKKSKKEKPMSFYIEPDGREERAVENVNIAPEKYNARNYDSQNKKAPTEPLADNQKEAYSEIDESGSEALVEGEERDVESFTGNIKNLI